MAGLNPELITLGKPEREFGIAKGCHSYGILCSAFKQGTFITIPGFHYTVCVQ